MSADTDPVAVPPGLAERIRDSGCTISVAESLTGGLLSNTFAALEGASDFFRGGVVAYAPSVKFDLLGLSPGPVVSRRAAREMASAARQLLHSDLAVAVTGVGGPGSQDGHAPGTVFISLDLGEAGEVGQALRISGSPAEVCRMVCRQCLALVDAAIGSDAQSVNT